MVKILSTGIFFFFLFTLQAFNNVVFVVVVSFERVSLTTVYTDVVFSLKTQHHHHHHRHNLTPLTSIKKIRVE